MQTDNGQFHVHLALPLSLVQAEILPRRCHNHPFRGHTHWTARTWRCIRSHSERKVLRPSPHAIPLSPVSTDGWTRRRFATAWRKRACATAARYCRWQRAAPSRSKLLDLERNSGPSLNRVKEARDVQCDSLGNGHFSAPIGKKRYRPLSLGLQCFCFPLFRLIIELSND
jgi:hypothetical protein